jgi:hypothetical protein
LTIAEKYSIYYRVTMLYDFVNHKLQIQVLKLPPPEEMGSSSSPLIQLAMAIYWQPDNKSNM